MKKELSSLDLHFITNELQILVGAKVEQIYQIGQEELFIQFHIPSKGKRLLRIVLGKLIYFASEKSGIPEKPPGYCVFLRKRLKNARVRDVRQNGFERALEFLFETKDAKYKFIIESFSTGNLILTDEKNMIISPLKRQEWKDRSLKPKVEYVSPTKDYNTLTISEKDFSNIVKNSDKESLVKTLAIDLSLGGSYSEELCTVSNVDKNLKALQLSDKEIGDLYKELKNLIKRPHEPSVVFKDEDKKDPSDIVPFLLNNNKKNDSNQIEKFETFSEALDFVLTKKNTNEDIKHHEKKGQTQIEKIEDIIRIQKQRIIGLEVSIGENQKKGEAVYENYPLVEQIINEIKEQRKTKSWKELKEALKNNKLIKSINDKTGEVNIDL